MKQKNRAIWAGALLGILIAGAAGGLSGCQSKKIQRIAAETAAVTKQPETELPEIVIEPDGRESEQPAIVIEQPENNRSVEDGGPGEKKTSLAENHSGKDGAVRLLFGGDVLLSDHVLNAYQRAGGIQGVVDDGYRHVIEESDFFMVNQEFPFSNRGTQAADKQYTFRLPPEKVAMFTELGINVVTLANNHALDFGIDALLDSCQVLDEAGILHTGAGSNLEEAKKPVCVELNGKKLAMIGATRVIPVADWAAGANHAGMLASYDPAVLLEEIRRCAAEQDYVMVFVHWGIERDEKPQEYQRALAKQYLDAGADIVIGSHPHVLQGIEYYKGKPIVYSLGNFVFGSSIPRTMLLEVTLPGVAMAEDESGDESAAGAALSLRLIPGTSSGGYTRMLTDPAALQEFFRYLESISFGVTYGGDGSVKPQP